MRIPRWTPLFIAGFVWAALAVAEAPDPLKQLKSKDYKVRLKAVEAIRKQGGEGAQKALVGALKDDDWEVIERACNALAEHGGEKAVKPLVDVAVKGPVRRVRLAAARTLTKRDVVDVAKRLTKRLRKDEGVAAADALTLLVASHEGPVPKELLKAVRRALKSKDARVRAAIAGTWEVFAPDERVPVFEKQLQDEDLIVVAAALDAYRQAPAIAFLPAIVKRFVQPKVNDVIARRLIAAIEALVAAEPNLLDDIARQLDHLIAAAKEDALASARVARLVGNLASLPPLPEEEDGASDKEEDSKKKTPEKGPDGKDKPVDGRVAPPPAPPERTPPVAPERALSWLETLLSHEGEGVRAEAVRSLRRINTTASIERAKKMLEDPHARVRIQALEAIVAGKTLQDADTLKQVGVVLAKDTDDTVREHAAVLLGQPGPDDTPFDGPVEALVQGLQDATWSVAAVSAVSLGKTRSSKAVEHLAKLLNLKEVKDWRLRGAAVVGLGRVQQKAAVVPLINALKDKDLWVRRNAYEFLKRLTKRNIDDDPAEWMGWWKFNEPGFEFLDRKKIAREMRKGGYAVDPVDVYEKGKSALDVVVLQSRGDHIEDLLEELGIEHRLTRAAQVEKSDLHSFAVFVANCTGEIQKNDIERLQWFVRVGGYLFCSCWALHHTIEKVYPGMIRKLPTRAEVLDNVVSSPCPTDSPYLNNVFRPWSRSIYVLFGSHLIEVLHPERVEVLIDSPQAATRWGGGNMAAWFPAGHGVILDSANHFDLQGLERVSGLKTAEDRMAYAMDHMGLDYDELRRHAAGKIWSRQADAVKLVRDLSAFRFITNFVRLKKKTDP